MADSTTPDRLLKERQAADYLGLSPRTLQYWRWSGTGPDLPYHKIGGAVRYSTAVLDRVKAAGLHNPNAESPQAA